MQSPIDGKRVSEKQGTRLFFAANLSAQLFALLRYSSVARIIGPEQLGYAALLLIVAQFFDYALDVGGDRFLVQDRDGDEPRVQGMVHALLIVRGVLAALLVSACAWPLSIWFGQQQIAFSLALIGLAPLISGFQHLDYRRRQRAHDFRGESVVLGSSELVGLIVTLMAAILVKDYTCVVYGTLARALTIVITSHAVAERSYSLSVAPAQSERLVRFAGPLMLNGVLLFFGQQGDRLIVADLTEPVVLGTFTAVILLIYYPCTMAQRLYSTFSLPTLANARHLPPLYNTALNNAGGLALSIALAFACGFSLFGWLAVSLIYGQQYNTTIALIVLAAILQTTRFLRIWPTIIAISHGKSWIVLANNVVRLVSIPSALLLYAWRPGVETIVAGFIIGELVALTTCIGLLARNEFVRCRTELVRVGLWLSICSTLTVTAVLWDWQATGWSWFMITVASALTVLVVWREHKVVISFLATARQHAKTG